MREDYQNRFNEIVTFGRTHCRGMDSEAKWEILLCDWFDARFFEGAPFDDGTKGLAAVNFHAPWLQHVRRWQRALRGWLKRAPRKTRPPLPWEAVLLIVTWHVARKQVAEALCLMVMFVCYLRPGEVSDLKVSASVPPTRYGTGTLSFWTSRGHLRARQQNGGVQRIRVLVWPELTWMASFFQVLREGRPLHHILRPFSHENLMASFRMVVASVKLDNLGPELYSLRHGGASRDAGRRARPLATVRMRGRWRTDSSLRRYEKHSQLQAQVHLLSKVQQDVAFQVEAKIEKAFRDPVFA